MNAMFWDIEMKGLMMWCAISWYAMRFEQKHHHTHIITKQFMNINLEIYENKNIQNRLKSYALVC